MSRDSPCRTWSQPARVKSPLGAGLDRFIVAGQPGALRARARELFGGRDFGFDPRQQAEPIVTGCD